MKLPSLSFAFHALLLALATSVMFGAYWLGRSVVMSDQIAVYQVLQNVSGIMFAVFGLWIGLLYPGLRKRVFERDDKPCTAADESSSSDNKVADHLLLPFFLSLIILFLTLLVIVIVPLLRQLPTLLAAKEILRGISFSLITLLAMLQTWTIFSAMHMTEALKGVISKGSAKKKIALRIRQNAKDGDNNG